MKIPMPIDEVKKYTNYEAEEIKIAKFLEAHKTQAFTSNEIYEGLKKSIPHRPNEKGSYWTWDNVGVFALNVLNQYTFSSTLRQMVKSGKIQVKQVKGQEYYFIE